MGEDAFYFLPNPFPEGVEVGVTKQTLAIVDDSNRQVPLSELYLHHIFGPSNLIIGEGAEFRGDHNTPPLTTLLSMALILRLTWLGECSVQSSQV
ncbi:hypothetical protein WJX79_000858 [Trebouxia sp. C0005]